MKRLLISLTATLYPLTLALAQDPRITSFSTDSNEQIRLWWNSDPSRLYSIESSTNLADWYAEIPYSSAGTASNSLWSGIHATDARRGFYRIIQAPTNISLTISDSESITNDAMIRTYAGSTQGLIRTTIGFGDASGDGKYDILRREDIWSGASNVVIRLCSIAEETTTGRFVRAELESSGVESNFYAFFVSLMTDTWYSVTNEINGDLALSIATSNVPHLESLTSTSLYLRFPKSAVTNGNDIQCAGAYGIAEPDPLFVWDFKTLGAEFRDWPQDMATGEYLWSVDAGPGRISANWDSTLEDMYTGDIQVYEVNFQREFRWQWLEPMSYDPYKLPPGSRSKEALVSKSGWWKVSLAARGYDDARAMKLFFGPVSARVYVPAGTVAEMCFIPAGWFRMGDGFTDGYSEERPVHGVYVSAFYMDKHGVTKAKWDEVYIWAIANGYSFDNAGAGKATNHPVHTVNWYDVVKWCNARSEKEGRTQCYTVSGQTYKTGRSAPDCNWSANGYRLPTEAEREKAARGGVAGHRFPWSDADTIQHERANYYSLASYSYDTSSTSGFHPTHATGGYPYTSPVGVFASNGYGLYDMAGNVYEWCWDWHGGGYYGSSPGVDPHGPASGSYRVMRGGGWGGDARGCRVAGRYSDYPDDAGHSIGFRAVLPPGQ